MLRSITKLSLNKNFVKISSYKKFIRFFSPKQKNINGSDFIKKSLAERNIKLSIPDQINFWDLRTLEAEHKMYAQYDKTFVVHFGISAVMGVGFTYYGLSYISLSALFCGMVTWIYAMIIAMCNLHRIQAQTRYNKEFKYACKNILKL